MHTHIYMSIYVCMRVRLSTNLSTYIHTVYSFHAQSQALNLKRVVKILRRCKVRVSGSPSPGQRAQVRHSGASVVTGVSSAKECQDAPCPRAPVTSASCSANGARSASC